MVNLEKNQNFYHVIRHAQRTSCWYFLQKSFVFIFNSKFPLKTHSQANSKTVSQHENIPNNNFVSIIPFFFLPYINNFCFKITVLDMADEMHDTAFIGWIFSCVNLTTLKLTFPFTGKCYKILKRIGITNSFS